MASKENVFKGGASVGPRGLRVQSPEKGADIRWEWESKGALKVLKKPLKHDEGYAFLAHHFPLLDTLTAQG